MTYDRNVNAMYLYAIMNSFKSQPKHVQRQLLEGNWEPLSLDSVSERTTIILKNVGKVADCLKKFEIFFVLAGGFPSWLLGLKYGYKDIDIFAHVTSMAQAKDYGNKLKEKFEVLMVDDLPYFPSRHPFVKELTLCNVRMPNQRKIIQIVFVTTRQRTTNVTEFTHGLIKHFPLAHIRIGMAYFSPNYTSCQMYRLDDTVDHYRETKTLKRYLKKYEKSYHHHVKRWTSEWRRIHGYSRLRRIWNLGLWVDKHALAPTKQGKRVCRADIKYNLRLTSLCLQKINKRCLNNYGNDSICKAAKLTYIK